MLWHLWIMLLFLFLLSFLHFENTSKKCSGCEWTLATIRTGGHSKNNMFHMQGSWVILSAHKQSIWTSENWVSTCFGSCCLTSAVHVRCSPLSQRFRVRSPLPAGTILQQSFPLIHQKTWGTWDVMCWVQLFRSPKMLPGVKISAISESNSSRQMSRTLTCAWLTWTHRLEYTVCTS